MAQQIRFFEKNKIDITNSDVELSVSDSVAANDGAAFLNYMRNRSNNSAFLTTGSNDAALTTININMVDVREIDCIIVIDHNLKSFHMEYLNDDTGIWTSFPKPIDVTDETRDTSFFSFPPVHTSQVKLTIRGTQTPNTDKRIAQLIITKAVGSGQFEGWPVIKPQLSLNRRVTKMLSGKVSVVEGIGTYEVELSVLSWRDANDLGIVESLYFDRGGFLVWPCGGDETQFSTVRRGYRLKDIYYMRVVDEFEPVYSNGIYTNGLNITIKLAEAL